MSVSNLAPFVEKHFFSSVDDFGSLVKKSNDHINIDLFLGSYSVALIYLLILILVPHNLDHCCFRVRKSGSMYFFSLFFFFKIPVDILDPLFHISFRISMSFATK